MSVLSDRLKKARERAGLKQIEACKKIGISNGTLSGYERDYRDPDTKTLEKMAEVYDVSVDWLLGLTDNYKKNRETDFDPIAEHNRLLKKYGIEDSGFFDIEKWKQMGPEELKQLEDYFEFIVSKAREKKKQKEDS